MLCVNGLPVKARLPHFILSGTEEEARLNGYT